MSINNDKVKMENHKVVKIYCSKFKLSFNAYVFTNQKKFNGYLSLGTKHFEKEFLSFMISDKIVNRVKREFNFKDDSKLQKSILLFLHKNFNPIEMFNDLPNLELTSYDKDCSYASKDTYYFSYNGIDQKEIFLKLFYDTKYLIKKKALSKIKDIYFDDCKAQKLSENIESLRLKLNEQVYENKEKEKENIENSLTKQRELYLTKSKDIDFDDIKNISFQVRNALYTIVRQTVSEELKGKFNLDIFETSLRNIMPHLLNPIVDRLENQDEIIKRLNKVIEVLNENVSGFNGKVSGLNDKVSNQDEIIKRLNKVIEVLNENVSGFNGKVSGLNDKVSNQDEIIKRLNKVIEVLNENVSGLNGKVSGLNDKVSGLNGKVVGLNGKVSGLNDKVSNQDEVINRLNKRIKKLETKNKKYFKILKAKGVL